MSILVANKVYRYIWSLDFWWKYKITECIGPYCEHEVQRFLFNVYKRFLFLSRFFTFFNLFYFNLNVFYIYASRGHFCDSSAFLLTDPPVWQTERQTDERAGD